MAKYKTTDVEAGQGLFLTVNLKGQLLPGTFECMLDEIIGNQIDISNFDKKYKNDMTGASAIPPSVLLKLIIYGYSKGCMSSRGIWELNRNNIIAKALTGDMNIHWTTISCFICERSKELHDIFTKVIMYCNELGLIGGEIFAIDGLRLPSNASRELSGTKEQLNKRLKLYQKMAEKHLLRHRSKDEQGETGTGEKDHFEERQKYLSRKIEKISNFLEKTEKKEGSGGQEIQSNVTDNESALIRGPNGFLQGYVGLAVSDQKNQVITSAEAFGSATENEHLPLMLDKSIKNLKEAGVKTPEEGKMASILGDAHYFSEDNLRFCGEHGLEAVIPDGQEKRCVCPDGSRRYAAYDFIYHEEDNNYECPQGKRLYYKGAQKLIGKEGKRYNANVIDCRSCPDFSRCISSKKEQSKIKRGRLIFITKSNEQGSCCRKMREKMATEEYKALYAHRIQIIEPVFANIGYCKGLNRFTLRGKEKVNNQWLLFCLMHNLGKCLKGYNAERRSA